jgi:hypothetical protein
MSMAEAQQDDLTYENLSVSNFAARQKGMHLSEIKAALPELEAACNRAIEASEAFSDLCTLIGLKAHTDAAVVKTFVTARCKDTEAKNLNKAEQLQILFGEFE